MPLTAADLETAGLLQFPMLTAGVVAVVNIEGVKPGDLVLDGATLARIFLGEVQGVERCRDPQAQSQREAAVAGDRRRVSFRRLRHDVPLHRLSRQDEPDLEVEGGIDHRRRMADRRGAAGNEGVAASVAGTKGSIGYVEYAYARQNRLTYSKLVNRDGKTVSPSLALVRSRCQQCELGGSTGLRRHPHQ